MSVKLAALAIRVLVVTSIGLLLLSNPGGPGRNGPDASASAASISPGDSRTPAWSARQIGG